MRRLRTRLGACLRNKQGLSMVNVMVAFSVLLLVMLMFQQAVRLSTNILERSEETRLAAEQLYSDFYEQTAYLPEGSNQVTDCDGEAGMGSGSFQFVSEDGSGGFSITANRGGFADGEQTVYFFGSRRWN